MRRIVSLLAFALLIEIGSTATAADARKPNVVVFLVDDMGWMDSTPYGSQYYDTPNMQRFAKAGMRFTNAYSCPLCSPTRASLLTGKYSARHGITSASGHQPPQPPGYAFLPERAAPNRPIVMPESKNYLEPAEYTLAEALRDAGYRTGHFGKWHLGLTEPHWPERQGFDVAFHAHPDPGPPNYFAPYRAKAGTITDGPAGEYITDRLTDEAIGFLEANAGRPFFLNLWHYGVHGPWGHKEELTRQYASRQDPRGKQGNPIMASMLKSVDESLGRVLDALERLKLADNTLVFFVSDNGGNVHSNTETDRRTQARADEARLADWRKWAGNQPPTNNHPLRNGKGTLYEGGVRVPLMVSLPGVVPPGAVSHEVVGAIDLYPTLLAMLGLPRPPQQKMDGISYAAALKQTGKLDRAAYFNYFPHGGPAKPPGVTVRAGDWKLIRWFETGPEYPHKHELYNLQNDLGEQNNLAAKQPDKVRELDGLIDGFLKDTGALVPKANPAHGVTPSSTAPSNSTPASGTPTKPIEATAADLQGWQPKNCKVLRVAVGLQVTAEGRNPFLAFARLKHEGPAVFKIRARTSTGGAGKVQWRTADQEGFSSEQVVSFQLRGGANISEAVVELPVKGDLIHVRLYLPAEKEAVELASIELTDKSGGAIRSWAFAEKE